MAPKHSAKFLLETIDFGGSTLPETNSSPLKMDGSNTSFLLGPGLFSGAIYVSFTEGIHVGFSGVYNPTHQSRKGQARGFDAVPY